MDIGPCMKLATSRPEQKLLPSPCRTTARTPGSVRSRSAAAARPWNIPASSALCRSGRAMVTVATWSATARRTGSELMPGS